MTPSQRAALARVLTGVFVVTEEQAGCPFLIGQTVRVQRQTGLSPVAPPQMVISPLSTNPNDARFNGLFAKLKPAVKSYKDGLLLCTCGISAHEQRAAEPGNPQAAMAQAVERPAAG